ncbi:putative EEIG1/EHBP1 N-terminal domain-containing protein [Heracleum sosnowskyi]|uniref:EEIG1/EHBP1 N-terminal domain-containing protein n=1 Tax=Heracleum sosnowskyi TaxID=360622 RepID=A0AAD8ICL8_9APIA|nr:putative EEIG1/EHBP1 N-terminal domain-containing protein [Heracleum sosnowskyi]
MLKLHRHKSNSSSDHHKSTTDDKIDFKFSNIQAFQVPKGWDKLYVSLISAKKGKTISKSGKASVRNGSCRWTETLSDSIWVARDTDSKDLEQCLFKLVVSMGSARTSILGEASINLTGHMNSKVSVPVSLPLKKCAHGTTIQVEVQCSSPRTKLGTENSNEVHSITEDVTADDDIDSMSNGSSYTFNKSFGSSSGNLSHRGEHGSRETSFSVGSEDSLSRESFSPQSNLSGVLDKVIGRQDSTGSQSSASYGSYHVCDSSTSNHSPYHSGKIPQNQREDSRHMSHSIATSPLQNSDSSNNCLEPEEVKTEELRAEAGMWERNARKLMLDIELLRKEFKDQTKRQTDLGLELSSSQTECAHLKKEIKHLKEEAAKKQKDHENIKLQALEKDGIQKELEDEIRFLRESNGNLALQLKKTQDSNLELVSVLQEMEETIEKQKVEIENLSSLNSKYANAEFEYNSEQKDIEEVRSSTEQVSVGKMMKCSCDSDPQSCIEHIITDIHTVVQHEKKLNLELQLQELQKTEMNSGIRNPCFGQTLDTRKHEISSEQDIKDQDSKEQSSSKLPVKVEMNLEAELSRADFSQELRLPDHDKRDNLDLINEIESLKEKVEELERDCNELTDENLELLCKLKESKKDLSGSSSFLNFLSNDNQEDTSRSTSSSEERNLESQLRQLKEEVKKKEILLQEVGFGHLQIQFDVLESKCRNLELQLQGSEDKVCYLDNELQKKCDRIEQQECEIAALQQKLSGQRQEETENDPVQHKRVEADLGEELLAKDSEIEELKADSLLKEIEIEALRHQQGDLRAHISDLQKLKNELEGNIAAMKREGSNITSESSNMLENDTVMVKSSTDSHIFANKIIEKKVMELENCRHDLELNLSELENENVQLSERVSGLEAQLRYMTEARESSRLEAQHSETQIINLQDEINRLVDEAEAQKIDMRHKFQDMQTRWLEAEEESAYLKKANPKLQATAETLIGECNFLQKTNGELRQQRIELNKLCGALEVELKESQNRFSGLVIRIEALEAKFSSMLSEFSSKEEILASELDAIHVLDNEYIEKLDLGESLLNQMYLDKAAEVEKIQQEVAHLNSQISATHDEREKRGSEAVLEMHILRANNDKLEATLQEVRGKLELSEKKLSMIQIEYDSKAIHLAGELAVSKQNHEVLVGKHEKLLGLYKDVKNNEEKLKGTVDELESHLKLTDCEKLQLEEETSSLRTRLQQVSFLQEEVLTLKTSVNEIKFDNQRLAASLQLISGDYEEVKAERDQLIQKISSMQNTVSELEDNKRSKVALEEKILRLEGDLSAREALCAQDAELKNEVGRIKRTSSQLQWKIRSLEEEKEECLDKVRALEEELKQKRENTTTGDQLPRSYGTYTDHEAPMFSEGGKSSNLDDDLTSRIQFLENELAEALEANDMYKAQLKSMLSDSSPINADSETIDKEKRMSLLETELKELRELYLHKSLKCAEVEAQREQLVMKLKTSNGHRRNWFS